MRHAVSAELPRRQRRALIARARLVDPDMERDARLLRQVLHRLDEAQAVVLGEEADGVAVRTAAEAVVGLARGADDEAGALFAVKRAQALEIDARLLQGDELAHHIGDVGAGQQVLDE